MLKPEQFDSGTTTLRQAILQQRIMNCLTGDVTKLQPQDLLDYLRLRWADSPSTFPEEELLNMEVYDVAQLTATVMARAPWTSDPNIKFWKRQIDGD